MKRAKRFAVFLVSVGFIVTLVACGGGGSSSGGGKSFVGRYSGVGNFTINGAGMSVSSPFSIVVVINPDSTVVLDPNTPLPGRGTISGNTITASYPAAFANSPGIVCRGKIDVNGTVAGNTITGNIGPSTFNCNNIPFTTRGTFTATLIAKAPLEDTSLGDALREAVRPAVGQ